MSKDFFKKGITVIEILIVLSVVAILVAVALPQFSKIKENQVLKNGVQNILSSLDKAHSQTLASLNSSEYGVRFEADKIIIFKGTSFPANDPNNESISIISPASISNVTLNLVSGIPGEMYFNRLSGVPSKTGTITVSVPSVLKIITISATGAVSVN